MNNFYTKEVYVFIMTSGDLKLFKNEPGFLNNKYRFQIHLLKTVNYKTEAMNIVYARFLFILISQKACKSLIYYRINGYHTEITFYYSLGKNRVH